MENETKESFETDFNGLELDLSMLPSDTLEI